MCCRPPNPPGTSYITRLMYDVTSPFIYKNCLHKTALLNDYFIGNTSSNKAGYWGDYACDLPLWTLENLLQHLASKSDEVN